MKKPERPEITHTHKNFYKQVTTIGMQMTEATRSRATERLGEFPSEASYARFCDFTAIHVSFKSKDSPIRARKVSGDVSGSDALAIRSVVLPEEGHVNKESPLDITFPGRIIGLELFYGDDEEPLQWSGFLYAGRGTPPVIVGEEAIMSLGHDRPSEESIGSVGVYMEKLPESQLIYPDEMELKAVLGALSLAQKDINVGFPLRAVYLDYGLNGLEADDPLVRSKMQWFDRAEEQF